VLGASIFKHTTTTTTTITTTTPPDVYDPCTQKYLAGFSLVPLNIQNWE
jgi:hypothetical protein